jgi:hypothetical protein
VFKKKKNKKRERIIRERIREDQFLKYLNMIP